MQRWIPLIALCFLLTPPGASAQTRPVEEEVRAWVRQLDDLSAPVREAAFDHLLHLPFDQLDLLRSVVSQGPLTPAQRSALKPIVRHVFLSGADYEIPQHPANPRGSGFLGVVLGTMTVGLAPQRQEGDLPSLGVVILERIPGFCGHASLRDGDVIVAIEERPRVPLTRMDVLRQLILSHHSGETIHLRLLRQGQLITVPVTLDPFPAALNGQNEMRYRQFLQERLDNAETYWKEQFQAVVDQPAEE